jgi:hypothetical protein
VEEGLVGIVDADLGESGDEYAAEGQTRGEHPPAPVSYEPTPLGEAGLQVVAERHLRGLRRAPLA